MTTLTQPNATTLANLPKVKIVNVEQLRDILLTRKGAAFASIEMDFDMLEKDKRGQYKKLRKNNPWNVEEAMLRKRSKQSILVTFDYDRALQKRTDGEEQAVGGPTWQQALTFEGKLTPLTVHKKDVAEYDNNGNVSRCIDNARFYLRCEYRGGKSEYYDESRTIGKNEVTPYLKKQGDKGAVNFHLVSLRNLVSLRMDGVEYRIAA